MIEENQLISHLYQNRDNGQWMIPVSYTHLDVYKRQVINRSEIEEASALGAVVMNGFARKKWASFQEAAAMRTIDNCIAPCMEEKELQSLYSGWREAVKKVIGQNN